MKINKIRIRNFKVFKDFFIDFDSLDTIVFDGPNGFGKTTIYDAIELVFTGKIRRYSALKSGLIDNRQTFTENPFYYEDAAEGENISIQIQLTSNQIVYILERVAQFDQIDGTIDFGIYNLYTKTDFDAGESTLIEDEQAYLSEIFGTNYHSNFQFLNYVEQEECLFLLKNSDKNRKNHIAHLFDLKEFELKIKRIETLKRRIDLLCNSAKKSEIDLLEQQIKLIKENLLTNVSESEYLKLFQNNDFDWDRENLEINNIDYQAVAGTNGILDRIKLVITRKDIFKHHRRNSGINYLFENRQLVKDYFKYSNFFARKDEFRILKDEVTALQSLISQLKNLNNQNLENPIDLSGYTFIVTDYKDRFSQAKEELLNILKELSGLDRIYADISISRNLLKEKLITLRDNGDANGECLLCGFDWETIEGLLNQIEVKATQIRNINSDKSNRFETSFTTFKTGILQELVDMLNQRLSNITFDTAFVDELLKIENNHFNQLIKTLDFLQFDYSRYLNQLPIHEAIILMQEFIEEITTLKVNVEEHLIELDFQDIFNQYFEGKHDAIDLLPINKVEKKQNYLKYLWSLSQNELLNTKNEIHIFEKQRYTDATELSSQLNLLKIKYQTSLKAFQKTIIKDIEIIFHVYSGRIMQCFQGGLGLFIFSEKEGIRFQSNPYKTYDAIFSMSSGQLSALIISFTLALHKKYAQNKLILIDDPVQTMDELNLFGFIDLLRNEFYNHQIIMSTHEDMMSAFMRYKFKNYNLSEKRFNMKDLLQN